MRLDDHPRCLISAKPCRHPQERLSVTVDPHRQTVAGEILVTVCFQIRFYLAALPLSTPYLCFRLKCRVGRADNPASIPRPPPLSLPSKPLRSICSKSHPTSPAQVMVRVVFSCSRRSLNYTRPGISARNRTGRSTCRRPRSQHVLTSDQP